MIRVALALAVLLTLAAPSAHAQTGVAIWSGHGNAPPWRIEFQRDSLMLTLDDGARVITAPVPRPMLPAWNGILYETAAQDRRITIAIRPFACRDSVTGERFPADISVEIEGERELQGCGRAANGAALPPRRRAN